MKYDAIAVIARGIYPDGTLYSNSILRVEHAAKLYHGHTASMVLLSGKWSFHDTRAFVRTEAEAMYIYGKTLGIAENNMICEPHSSSTIENILNIKTVCLERGMKSVVFVCGKDHRARVNYLARIIFGDDLIYDISVSKRVLTPYEIIIRPFRELLAFVMLVVFLRGVQPGDHETV